ncbi:hypothetical protein HPB50_002104 [Hyalomma asiaticum]|uniref:Uncharacterized protein n=1 Tax=Hyalomma asiaticum TaxID=266040 RepID=A0ACB7RIE2_HYAAI|nr:hypothetical protein HPB50_002104 [Hyalomma asiaticum]
MCCMVPAVSLMLPCGHILCEFCKDQAGEGCPFDGMKFTNDDAVAFTVTLSDLELLQVVCIARDRQTCSFIGRISELRAHLVECGRGYVQCSSCGETLYRKATAEHYRECRKRRVAAFESAFGVQRPRSPEDVLDTGDEVHKAAPKDSHSGGRSGAAGNCENDLSDGPASVESGSSAETQAVDVGDSRGKSTRQAPRESSNSGPFRAATRPGVFTCTCVFLGVYAGYHSARRNNEHTIETEHYVLAGYTFKLYCKFSRDEVEKARVRFGMALCQGAWDSSVQWPFSKSVTLILTHVRDMTKDVRLPLPVHGIERVARKPRPFVPNGVLWSKSEMWRDLELLGYVDDDNVYFTVEME